MIKMCDEMVKLREFLDKKGIKWFDNSETIDESMVIYRTKFELNSKNISVIFGHGTCGGVAVFNENINHEKLEMMIDNNEPEGWLTAEDIIKQLDLDVLPVPDKEETLINRLIELIKSEDIGEVMEATSCDSEYPSYVKWPEDIADELEEICCTLFITTNGGVNWENINKLRKASNNEIDVVRGDGDSFGWLTGVVCSDDASIMYYCFG